MKTGLKTIGNATLLAYDQNKPVIVTDPWLNDHSAYFGSWTLPYKIPEDILQDIFNAEFIWLSHGHPDHINPDSILEFKDKTILLADHVGNRIKDNLIELGFNVKILTDRKWIKLSNKIKIFSIADYAQNSILLIDINEHLFVNLNDSPERWWGRTIKKIIKRYDNSYVLKLMGASDADMINFYNEKGEPMPRLPETKILNGKKLYELAKYWGTTAVIPFSNFHKYQRSDTNWINEHIMKLEDYKVGFPDKGDVRYIEPFAIIDCISGEISSINPSKTEDKIYRPEDFGDNWSDTLTKKDFNQIINYFKKKEKIKTFLGFINFKVGGVDNIVMLNKRLKTGITFEVPRTSLLMAIKYEIFDDLLIGNFAKTTLHNIESLYNPNFNLFLTKIADNGRARSLKEIEIYFNAYKSRNYLDYYIEHLQSESLRYIRKIIHRNNYTTNIARSIKRLVSI